MLGEIPFDPGIIKNVWEFFCRSGRTSHTFFVSICPLFYFKFSGFSASSSGRVKMPFLRIRTSSK
jgi:hypothetical protein